MNVLRITLLSLLLTFSLALVSHAEPLKASKDDKCPVCGMFVAKYPDFLAQIVFTDGSYALFDGAKDMFKYYFGLSKYNPSKNQADIAAFYVTNYYTLTPLDGRKAWYVVGSDVFGPMGRELIPFANEEDANEFMVDHGGKTLVRFKDVTQALVQSLD